ncbi:MAG TPA: SUMF1/EgtB/PvdO family nonheme iron enzyme [Kofleriaceae bacterium]
MVGLGTVLRVVRIAILLALAACGSSANASSDATVVDDTLTPPPDAGPCPANMVLVTGFCIDRYEAALEEQVNGSWQAASPYLTVGTRTVRAVPAAGIVPQGYISGREAAAACAASGKRLCTSPEWLAACRGPDQLIWPYGNTHIDAACNDDYPGTHPVIDYFGTSTGVFDSVHMNDPGINQQPNTVSTGGERSQCISAYGAYDMHGNLHEWVDDPAGTFRGGFYADGSINGNGCLYVTTAHDTNHHDYSTGFRCCASPQ